MCRLSTIQHTCGHLLPSTTPYSTGTIEVLLSTHPDYETHSLNRCIFRQTILDQSAPQNDEQKKALLSLPKESQLSFLCDNDKNFGVIVTKVNDFCPTCKNEAARVRLQREIAAEEERRARIEERRQAERKRKSEELEGSDHDNSKKWKDKGKGKVEETIGNGPALLRRSPRIAIRDKNGNNVNIADLISPKPSEKKARLEADESEVKPAERSQGSQIIHDVVANSSTGVYNAVWSEELAVRGGRPPFSWC